MEGDRSNPQSRLTHQPVPFRSVLIRLVHQYTMGARKDEITPKRQFYSPLTYVAIYIPIYLYPPQHAREAPHPSIHLGDGLP
jgi:hypothetical protein